MSATLELFNNTLNQFAVNPSVYSLVADTNSPNQGTLFAHV